MVFNGNGRSGAAGAEANRLSRLGYKVAGATNASHQDYATSVVMYRPGYRAEGQRLAKDLGVKVVGPLDGISAAALHGGELAVVVGAS
jgi:molybdopterin-guanine dinucleotide biosynthesis protein A